MLSGVWWMLFQPMARQTCATAVRSAAFVMSDSVTVILMVSVAAQYLNYLIFSEKSQQFEFKCEVSLGRNKCDVVVDPCAVTGGGQEADPLLGVRVPGDVGPHGDGRHWAS